MAEDLQILDQYLTSNRPTESNQPRVYHHVPSTHEPITYFTIQRGRKGVELNHRAGRSQREILEQIVGQSKVALVQLFFERINSCFPVLDEVEFFETWRSHPEDITSSLLCDIYASATVFWKQSEELKHLNQPDPRFTWNQAVAALREDFAAPTMSTMHAAVIDLVGRPILGITDNVANVGRLVALAHSLGLHRDPARSFASTQERNDRTRLWWCIYLHDTWSSFAHGVPPYVQDMYCDVPVPTKAAFPVQSNPLRENAAETFLHLCLLTRLLSDILPFVYSLQNDPSTTEKKLRKATCALDDWEENLPTTLRDGSINPGGSNLWFCYLSVRLLTQRLAMKAASSHDVGTLDSREARSYQMTLLRGHASDLIDFVVSLKECSLYGFWLPYTAHILASATIIYLRCAVDAANSAREECVATLIRLHNQLQNFQKRYEWDIADMCLERCKDLIEKLSEVQSQRSGELRGETGVSDLDGSVTFPDPDLVSWNEWNFEELADFLRPVPEWEFAWDGVESHVDRIGS
ncbi:hypothetical protein K431DRAFT_241866 [Polychaeton citri CBS 116435]|uniref:Xylanolytic transcriptional activator regulatory domain-containing protein n=1 Tax=Polychaeton citri CBS 116435 TaxID=1314669 RepID=A0A9P4USW7_9PEZI|nr:hypothetical protein K431DRAFT_241866 [Polychaeton citri CBS 116435]